MCDKVFWLDVDAGVDDAQAILIVLTEMEKIGKSWRLAGISCVSGNVDAAQVSKNVMRIIDISRLHGNTAFPVVSGPPRPLVETFKPSHFFGRDGLGDVDVDALFLQNGSSDSNEKKRGQELECSQAAALHLVECAKTFGKSLTIVATGPLTNLALACRLDENFASSVGRVVVMGGSTNEDGQPEYNFKIDPEAAHICLDSFPLTTLVTWECGTDHVLPWNWFYKWLSASSTAAKFMQAACKGSAAFYESQGCKGYISCDVLAAVVALHPEWILDSKSVCGKVELGWEGSTRGKLSSTPGDPSQKRNVVIVLKINMLPVFELLEQSLGDHVELEGI